MCDKSIEKIISNPTLSVRQALENVLNDIGEELTAGLLKGLKKVIKEVDSYIRFYFRKELLYCLIRNGFIIHVAGSGYETIQSDKIISHGALDISDIISLMNETKIVINPLPNALEGGYHERIFMSFMSKSVLFTPYTEFHAENLGDRVKYIDLNNLSNFVTKLNLAIETYDIADKQIEDNYKFVRENHTFKQRGKEIIEFHEKNGYKYRR